MSIRSRGAHRLEATLKEAIKRAVTPSPPPKYGLDPTISRFLMTLIRYEGKTFEVGAEESLLDSLNAQGASIPSSCRSGLCQTCLMQARSGTPPESSQEGLLDALRLEHYFLALHMLSHRRSRGVASRGSKDRDCSQRDSARTTQRDHQTGRLEA